MAEKNLNSEDKEFMEELAADGSPSGIEFDTEWEQQEPFDPEKISIDSKVISMDALIRRLLQGTIRLAPAFQRKMIWDMKRKSQLIESLMLKIPIPMFYVAADEKGNWDVVDGLQRLTAIREFILGQNYMESGKEEFRGKGFQLQDLEFWGDKYNRSTFSELPNPLTNRMMETEFRFTIINPGTPEKMKRNVFKRINTGGMPLTSQEIRHALYQGNSTRLLEELVETPEFKKATGNSVKDSRMGGRELILRFLAFSIIHYEMYPKNSDMDTFLCNAMRVINIMPGIPPKELSVIFRKSNPPPVLINNINLLRRRFINGMIRAYKIFGKHCFRKSFGRKKSPVNKALFEAWGNILADLDADDFEILMTNKKEFFQEYHTLLGEQNFISVISRYSSKHSSVQTRFTTLYEIIHRYINKEESA